MGNTPKISLETNKQTTPRLAVREDSSSRLIDRLDRQATGGGQRWACGAFLPHLRRLLRVGGDQQPPRVRRLALGHQLPPPLPQGPDYGPLERLVLRLDGVYARLQRVQEELFPHAAPLRVLPVPFSDD